MDILSQTKADESIERLYARLVAKGFHQRPRIDFKETFSAIVKLSTVKTVLSITVTNGWVLKQLDVNDTFLQGHLIEVIVMLQPPVFIDTHISP